jgi:L-histidine N-alpha-methyltransferase
MRSNAIATEPISEFAADVRAGLTRPGQKELPSKYLYDALGSKLFEAICELPEYGLTRADERLLREHAREIATRIPGDVVVCELGSGSGRKTRWILEALARRRHINYFPIEISPVALAVCRRELSDIDSVGIVGLEREYLDGLLEVAAQRKDGQRLLVLFLGSTLGNFSPPADVDFMRDIRRILRTGDTLLLGTDLQKPLAQLMDAYDDPLGVTAAFNLNLLARMNRELEADFVLSQFEHHATFNSATSSVEMHLRSLRKQKVTLPKAYFAAEFKAGETIWTENCHKFSLEQVKHKAQAAGFEIEAQWIDHDWPFAESLLAANVE